MDPLELPMSIKIDSGLDAFVSIHTPLGDGKVSVKGPLDENNNGDPEVEFVVDLPGTVLDQRWTVEIPIGTFVGGSLPQIVAKGLESAPDFPGKSFVVKAIDFTVERVGKMFFGEES